MYINTTTQKTTKYPQDAQGRVISADDLAANNIYPLAEQQPTPLQFQVQDDPPNIVDGYAVKKYKDIPLTDVKQQLIASLKARRRNKEYSAIEVVLPSNNETHIADASLESRDKINGAIDASFSGVWFFEGSSANVDVNDLIAVKTAIINRTKTLFESQSVKLAEIESLTTVAECRTFDLNYD